MMKLFWICILASVTAGCATRALDKSDTFVSRANPRATNEIQKDLDDWMQSRPSDDQLESQFGDDIRKLRDAFSRPLGKRDKFYEFNQPATAAAKFLASVLPRLPQTDGTSDVYPGKYSLSRADAACLAIPGSNAAQSVLKQARTKLSSVVPEEVAEGYGMRITLEVLDLIRAAGIDPPVAWEKTQYHASSVGQRPPASAFHRDGGYMAVTLTLTGFGTEVVTNPEINPRTAWRDAGTKDWRRTRTGRYVFFAALDFGREGLQPIKDPDDPAESTDSVSHRATQTDRHDRRTWVVRLRKIEQSEDWRERCLAPRPQ
jgi:hypothetical protein